MVIALWLSERPRIQSELSAVGLHEMQGLALHHLEKNRPRPMNELAHALSCDASNVTGIADRLEAAGLVERRPAEHDRRVKTLALTPRGQELKEHVTAIWNEPPPGIERLPESDIAQLGEILERALS